MLSFAAAGALAAVASSIVLIKQGFFDDDRPVVAPPAAQGSAPAANNQVGIPEPSTLSVQLAGGPALNGLYATVTVPGVKLDGRTAFAYQRNQSGHKWYRHNCVDDSSGIVCKDVRFGDDATAKATYDVLVVIVDEAGRRKLIDSTRTQSFITVDPTSIVPPAALRAFGTTHAERRPGVTS